MQFGIIYLFPKTDLAGLDVIKIRIDSFLNSIITKGKFDIKTEYFSSTQENIVEENGQQLIAKLTNKLLSDFLTKFIIFSLFSGITKNFGSFM